MCADCFDVENHKVGADSALHAKNHSYTRNESSGGGCCDCGDLESWNKEAWCAKHRNAKEVPNPDLLMSEEWSLSVRITHRERERTSAVFDVVAILILIAMNQPMPVPFNIPVVV